VFDISFFVLSLIICKSEYKVNAKTEIVKNLTRNKEDKNVKSTSNNAYSLVKI